MSATKYSGGKTKGCGGTVRGLGEKTKGLGGKTKGSGGKTKSGFYPFSGHFLLQTISYESQNVQKIASELTKTPFQVLRNRRNRKCHENDLEF